MFTSLKSCFVAEKVNTGRQLEFDLAKGLAILFMVWVHTLEETESVSDALMPTLIEKVFGGPFAAPVFMVALGIGLAYSKHHKTPRSLMQRGMAMLLIGFLLNLVRFTLPSVWEAWGTDKPLDYEDIIMWQVSVDILQFAGLAFLYFALAKKWQFDHIALAVIAVGCSLLATAMHGITIENVIGKQFLGYIWMASEETFFPFLNWIIFPTFGCIFGAYWQRCQNKSYFYQRVAPVALLLGLGYMVLTMNLEWGMYRDEENAHYYMNLLDASFILMFVLGWFGVCYGLLCWLPEKIFKPLLNLSRNINQVYCIHWMILGFFGVWFRTFLEKTALPVWEVSLYALLILIAAAMLAEFYVRFVQRKIFRVS